MCFCYKLDPKNPHVGSSLAGKVLLFGFRDAKNKTKVEIEVAQVLFNDQRMENQKFSSQITFSTRGIIKVLRARLMRGKHIYWSANDLIFFFLS